MIVVQRQRRRWRRGGRRRRRVTASPRRRRGGRGHRPILRRIGPHGRRWSIDGADGRGRPADRRVDSRLRILLLVVEITHPNGRKRRLRELGTAGRYNGHDDHHGIVVFAGDDTVDFIAPLRRRWRLRRNPSSTFRTDRSGWRSRRRLPGLLLLPPNCRRLGFVECRLSPDPYGALDPLRMKVCPRRRGRTRYRGPEPLRTAAEFRRPSCDSGGTGSRTGRWRRTGRLRRSHVAHWRRPTEQRTLARGLDMDKHGTVRTGREMNTARRRPRCRSASSGWSRCGTAHDGSRRRRRKLERTWPAPLTRDLGGGTGAGTRSSTSQLWRRLTAPSSDKRRTATTTVDKTWFGWRWPRCRSAVGRLRRSAMCRSRRFNRQVAQLTPAAEDDDDQSENNDEQYENGAKTQTDNGVQNELLQIVCKRRLASL
jgi:hypothetical protein